MNKSSILFLVSIILILSNVSESRHGPGGAGRRHKKGGRLYVRQSPSISTETYEAPPPTTQPTKKRGRGKSRRRDSKRRGRGRGKNRGRGRGRGRDKGNGNGNRKDDRCNGFNNDLIVVAFDGIRWDYVLPEYQNKYGINLSNFSHLISGGSHILQFKSVMPTVTYPNFYSLSTGLYPGSHGIPFNTFYDPLLNDMKNKSNDDDESGVWWLANPIWTTIQDNDLSSAVFYWKGSRSNNDFNGNNNGFPNWYYPDPNIHIDDVFDPYMDFYLRSDIWLDEISSSHYNLGMMYYNEPDHIAHDYGPNHILTAQIMQYNDNVLGYLINKLDLIYSSRDNDYNIIIVSDHGFTECIVPSPLILDMSLLDKYFITDKSLRFDVTAPQLGIKIIDKSLSTDFVINLLLENIVDASLYLNKLFWIFRKGEIPYNGLNTGTLDYRLSDIFVEVAIGYEWNIINSVKYNRNVDCGGGHSWNNSETDMKTTLIANGPDFKQNYIKDRADNIHFYELMCKVLCDTKPKSNDGQLKQIKDILIKYDDNKYRYDDAFVHVTPDTIINYDKYSFYIILVIATLNIMLIIAYCFKQQLTPKLLTL